MKLLIFAHTPPPQGGFLTVAGHMHQITSIPVDQGQEHIATLSVGERFDFSDFSTPAVLARNGKVVMSNIPAVPAEEIEAALASCRDKAECEVRLRGDTYLSLPVDSIYFGDGYVLPIVGFQVRIGCVLVASAVWIDGGSPTLDRGKIVVVFAHLGDALLDRRTQIGKVIRHVLAQGCAAGPSLGERGAGRTMDDADGDVLRFVNFAGEEISHAAEVAGELRRANFPASRLRKLHRRQRRAKAAGRVEPEAG